MNIGIFTQNTISGGMDTFIINLINNSENHNLYLFYNESKNLKRINLEIKNNKCSIIKYNYFISNNIKNKNYYFSKIIRRILNSYFFTFGLFYNIFRLKKIFQKYKIDKLIVVNGNYPGGELCLSAIFAWNKISINKAILSIHNYPNNIRNYSYQRKFYENYIDKLISKSVKKIITVSKNCKESFKVRPFINKNLIDYIYNGYEKKELNYNFNLRAEIGLSTDAFIIFLPGVFEKRKGHEVAIKAMDKLYDFNNNIQLVICGEGDEKNTENLENIIKSSKFKKNIHIINFKNNIDDLYHQVDLVVAPSLEMESFGYIAIEAMSHSVPVIASNMGGLKEIIAHNTNGFLFEKGNYNDLVLKIFQLLENNDKFKLFKQNAYDHYKKKFTSKIMAKKYFNYL